MPFEGQRVDKVGRILIKLLLLWSIDKLELGMTWRYIIVVLPVLPQKRR